MKILLGVTGGIAAYKSLQLVRLWVKAGHEVQVVMTEGAKAFIQPLSFQTLTGQPVRDALFDETQEAGMSHIALARWADVMVIAPATANTIAKVSLGLADDLLSTLVLASERPLFLAPAMNRLMWQHPATQENIQRLKQRGVQIIPPASGEQACGEVGEGRMAEPEEVVRAVITQADKPAAAHEVPKTFWHQVPVLVTAGPTHEPIDPVRFIGNRSSGKMGYAIAKVLAERGADVILISGPTGLETPPGVKTVSVKTAQEMFSAVQAFYADAEVFISAAAVADYRVAEPASHKLKKQPGQESMALQLVKNPDIVAWVAQQPDKPYTVGFAAETEDVLGHAEKKLQQKNLDMICANQVGEHLGFEQDENALWVLTPDQQYTIAQAPKEQVAQQLVEVIEKTLQQSKALRRS
ncbi:bifunctional phosphopantothenoylcysteine decarboxylase/phosphopantothenate--cysteine ligase CoaBC [Galenea microaerophila]